MFGIQKLKFTFIQVLALGFALIILAGALLLSLPMANRSGRPLPYVDALFTSTSATCVTGLVVYDTYSQFTLFGQVVILLLIQIGGLGFMTIAILFSMLTGKRIGLKERGLLMEAVNTNQIGGIVKLIKRVLIGTAIFEFSGAALLACRFIPRLGWKTGLWYGLFHAVSAFCNAGFDLMGRMAPYCSLTPFADDVLVNVVIMTLIVVGGLGFIVWNDMLENKWHFSKYRLHTKIVLAATGVLIVFAAALFLITERNAAFAGMSAGERVLAGFFQAVTPRTAGFNTVEMTALSQGGRMLTILLMLVGASPGSTAGGIKTTTLVTIIMSVVASSRHRDDVNVFRRRLDPCTVKKAYGNASLYIITALAGCFVIVATQHMELSDAVFECFSAMGTVGLSTGVTRALTPFSRIVIALLMYNGRVGSLSLAMAVAERRRVVNIKNPEEKITVG